MLYANRKQTLSPDAKTTYLENLFAYDGKYIPNFSRRQKVCHLISKRRTNPNIFSVRYCALSLVSASSSALSRMRVGGTGRKCMSLQIDSLLQDSCENKLSSDDRKRRRHGGATQPQVLHTGNHYGPRLRDGESGDRGAVSQNNDTRQHLQLWTRLAPCEPRASFSGR